MRLTGCIRRELARFGEEIQITDCNGKRKVRGILQPLLYKNKMYLGGKHVPTGLFDRGHYLLICPPEAQLPESGTVLFESKGGRYMLKRSEIVKHRSKPLYTWAVLCPYKENLKEEIYETSGDN